MLSAFQPQPVVELKARDKSRIEAVLAYGDRLLVGLNTGHLRIYRFNESHEDATSNGQQQDKDDLSAPRMVELLREEDKFSRKPIQQLAIIKEAGILISLSDGYVSFYDLQTYALSERLDKSKGATLFAAISNIVKDPTSGIPSIVSRLAVAVKRKILVWTWRDMELAGAAEEYSLIASVKSLTWSTGTKIVAGLDPGYFVVDVETRAISDVNRTVGSGEAIGVAGPRFGAVNSSGMGYMGMGSWVPKPMATKLSEGQLLLAKDVNTLFIDADGKPMEKRQVPWAAGPEAVGYSYPYMLALQAPSRGTLEVRNPDTLTLLQSISVPNATILHVPQPYISLAHAGKGFLVASDRCIWRMSALGYSSQIDALLRKPRYDEAISLVNMLEDTLLLDKEARLREIRMQKAHWLFGQQKYRDALDLFSAAQAPPARVIALYPESIAGHVSARTAEANASDVSARKSSIDHDSSVLTSIAPATDVVVDNGGRTISPENLLEGKDLTLAVHELRAFLAGTRVQLQKFIAFDGKLKPGTLENKANLEHLLRDPIRNDSDLQTELLDTATLVDTTLFRAYMLVSPSLAGSLFRLDNFCAPDVVEEKLYETGRYNDLIDFLHGKRLHRDALEMLEKFGQGDAQANAQEGFHGPERTVRYLQQLPFEMVDLILQHAEWPIRDDPDLGMEVFLADTENAETLPRDRVLEFLQNIDSKLALRYLEHIIEELHDSTPPFHDRLVELYLEKLKGVDKDTEALTPTWQSRFEHFLRTSEAYNKYRALRDLPTNDAKFYESRAIVLSKLSRHKEALQIYVYQMEDYKKAEDYCNQIYLLISSTTKSGFDPDDAEQESIYTTLLSLYLTPPRNYQSNPEAALNLVSRHGSRLPAMNTLSILPLSLPIKQLESYFEGRMRAANSKAREEAIIAALSGVEKLDWEAALLLGDDTSLIGGKKTGGGGRNRRVIIGENRLCRVCNKRFGKAAVRVYPDGDVVHYGCSERRDSSQNVLSP